MTKKRYLIIGALALFIYLLFPEYQKFRDYRKAAADPLSARASHFIYTYSDSWYSNRLEKKYDDAKLKDLLSRCEASNNQGRFGGALNCCDALRWHIRHSEKMYNPDRYRSALDSCSYYNYLGQPAADRVHIYRTNLGRDYKSGEFRSAIDELAKGVSPADLLDRLNGRDKPEIKILSGHRDLIEHFKTARFSETIPVHFETKASFPKFYHNYSSTARAIVEAAMGADPTYYLNGKQPKATDFENVQVSTWSFRLQGRDDYRITSQLEDHLNLYYDAGRIQLKATEGAPLDRPRIEVSFRTKNLEDTIQGIVVPILSVISENNFSTTKYESSFVGYSLTTELECVFTFYPKDPQAPHYVYRGMGGPDEEVYSIGSSSPMALTDKAHRTALDNTIGNLLGKIYDQVPLTY